MEAFFPTLFCLLMYLITTESQGETEFLPNIYGNEVVCVGDTLDITCSTFGFINRPRKVYIYLCKNAVGIDVKESQMEKTAFSVHILSEKQSGNYSCVVRTEKYQPHEITGQGYNSLIVQVTSGSMPAVISVTESMVREGSDIEFTCISSELPNKAKWKTNTIYAYLYKEGTAIMANIWDPEKMKTYFILKSVQKKDSGSYGCFLGRPVLLSLVNSTLYGNNTVTLHIIEGFSGVIRVVLGSVISLVILSLILGLCRVIRNHDNNKCSFHRSSEAEGDDCRGTEIMGHDEAMGNSVVDCVQNEVRALDEWEDFSDISEEDVSYHDIQGSTVEQLWS